MIHLRSLADIGRELVATAEEGVLSIARGWMAVDSRAPANCPQCGELVNLRCWRCGWERYPS